MQKVTKPTMVSSLSISEVKELSTANKQPNSRRIKALQKVNGLLNNKQEIPASELLLAGSMDKALSETESSWKGMKQKW